MDGCRQDLRCNQTADKRSAGPAIVLILGLQERVGHASTAEIRKKLRNPRWSALNSNSDQDTRKS